MKNKLNWARTKDGYKTIYMGCDLWLNTRRTTLTVTNCMDGETWSVRGNNTWSVTSHTGVKIPLSSNWTVNESQYLLEALNYDTMPTKDPHIIIVYETSHTDGYKNNPGGDFFRTKEEAVAYAKVRFSGHGSSPIVHNAMVHGNGLLYLLKQVTPVTLADATQEVLEAKKRNAALNKLTDEDKKILGL